MLEGFLRATEQTAHGAKPTASPQAIGIEQLGLRIIAESLIQPTGLLIGIAKFLKHLGIYGA